MTMLGRIRAISLTLALAVLASFAGFAANAQSPAFLKLTANDLLQGHPVYLGINKSVVIDLPRAAGDVLVSNPQIADAVLRTSSRLYLIGVALGQASVFLFDSSGAQIANFDVYVEADLGSLNQLLTEAIPNGYVRAEAIQGSIVLRGQVPSAADASRAVEITQSMIARSPISTTGSTSAGTAAGTTATSSTSSYEAGSGPGIINLLTITGEEQVALKVQIVEVQRSVVKQLGVNLKGVFLDGGFGVGTNLANTVLGTSAAGTGGSPLTFPFNSATSPGEVGMDYLTDDGAVQGTLRALEETRMLRTLAEPTLTAVSGETANFLAGGEFPIPVSGQDGEISIQFKQFGVNLAFTPVVLSPGRISLKLRTEVSDISAVGAISLPLTGTSSITIPATSVRRAETSIELPSGGSFMIAGMIRENTRRAASGLPWLQKLPILGTLFSSKDFLSDQTELLMIVTAYLVEPVSPQALARPDDGMFMANDAEAYFLNRLTKVYGTEGQVQGGSSAHVGYNFD